MKHYLLMSLAILVLPTHAAEIRVSHMTLSTGFDFRYNLTTSIKDPVILDCQSFIQGLFIGASGAEQTILMAEWECEELVSEMNESLGRKEKHCLEVDTDRGELTSHQSCPQPR